MNKRTFLKHLGKCKGMFELNNGEIRTKDKYVILYDTWNDDERKVCPIEGIGLQNGKTKEYSAVSFDLGIDDDLENLIVAAADADDCMLDDGDRKKYEGLRNSMLRVLGLKENK